MKVLAVIPTIFGSSGDAVNERQLLIALAKRVEKCYVVTFISLKEIFMKKGELGTNLPKNIILIPIPFPFLKTFTAKAVLSFIAIIVGFLVSLFEEIDLIYVRYSFLSLGFLAFPSLARKTVVKIGAIFEDEILGDSFTKFLIKKFAPFADRLVLARARRIAVNNRVFYYELVRRRLYKHKANPVEIPPGIDPNLIKKVKNQAKIKKLLQEDFKNIGFIGTLLWWQGVDILVRAIAMLKETVPNVRLVIIGDGELRNSVEKLCKELRVNCMITGYLPHEKALQYLNELDIMVLPSRKLSTTESNIPIKVIEAWALGIPVVVTAHKVFLMNGIKNNEDVVYCEPEPTSVARAILLVAGNNALKKKLIENGPKLASHFYYDKIAENLLSCVR
jgi:glycosyltransferase involved in cell wall biosynthesis